MCVFKELGLVTEVSHEIEVLDFKKPAITFYLINHVPKWYHRLELCQMPCKKCDADFLISF